MVKVQSAWSVVCVLRCSNTVCVVQSHIESVVPGVQVIYMVSNCGASYIELSCYGMWCVMAWCVRVLCTAVVCRAQSW